MFNKRFFAILTCIVVIASCKKDAGVTDPVPKIISVSLSSNSVQSLTDSIVFTVKYQDGDGDLGENSADVKNLFVIDNRIPLTYPYRIQQLAPDNSSVPIQGKLNIVLKGIGITDSSASQNTTFSIYVVDRAGHQSNTVTSGTVVIHQ
jgi:hypothetical protein